MHPSYYIITPQAIYRYAATVRQPPLRWQDHGPKGTVTPLLQILFSAAAPWGSLYAAWARLRHAPSDQAVRAALAALGPEAETLEQQLNRSFAEPLPKVVKQRR